LKESEWRRQQEEAALRRAEAKMREEKEAKRTERFLAAARRWDEANRLGAYLSAFREAMGPEQSEETVRWLAWAKEYAEQATSKALSPSTVIIEDDLTHPPSLRGAH
jgi:hypothetical protein